MRPDGPTSWSETGDSVPSSAKTCPASATTQYHGSVRPTALRSLPVLPGDYSLVLLDPPYRIGAFHGVLEAIAGQPRLLTQDAMVVGGHSRQAELRSAYGEMRRTVFRQYGDNAVSIYLNVPDSVSGDSPDEPG